jgi:hypothetical protein
VEPAGDGGQRTWTRKGRPRWRRQRERREAKQVNLQVRCYRTNLQVWRPVACGH